VYTPETLSTGVPGFDNILHGGLPAQRLNLLEGQPGTGKTTLALQFLMEGARQGETVLYVTLSETADELQAVARSHGWSLDGVLVRELAPNEDTLRPDQQYTVFHPADVELSETIWAVLAEAENARPTRVVLDSLAELRLLAGDALRYRRQILGLKHFFARRNCTVLLLDSHDPQGSGLESICHSVIRFEQLAPEYGGQRRRLRVMKIRGSRFRGGYHDFIIKRGGIEVFPSLVAVEHTGKAISGQAQSGVPELDDLIGGGLDRGCSTLLVGPAGAGKSAISTQFAAAAAARGERSVIYMFDESEHTFLNRAAGLGVSIQDAVSDGRVTLRHLDPAQLSPGQFDAEVRYAVEQEGASLVIVDSLNGYLNAMAEEHLVFLQLHELLTYLGHKGVVTIMTVAQAGLVGNVQSPIDVSYLADTVITLRYFEAGGEIRQALSVIKRRGGAHERSIRELKLGPGLRVGPPLRNFHGVLSGTPSFVGSEEKLLGGANEPA
jgi:circadian clock protein KaiC